MANQHFVIDLTAPHGKLLAKMIDDCQDVLDMSARLKVIADEVTGGGTSLTAANTDYYDLFGMDTADADAGSTLYTMLQSIMAGTVTSTTISEFDQGL